MRRGVIAIVVGVMLVVGVARAQIARHVPRHDPSLVAGCTPAQLHMVMTRISDAIDVGAPIYNLGDEAGCYHVYEEAARAIEAALPNACSGPSRALRDGRARAASLTDDDERAWAMRDAFDGLIYLLVTLGVH